MTSRAIRTRRSPNGSASPRVVRNHNCSRRGRSSAHCSRISSIHHCGKTCKMSHLSIERLAALADEQPDADEQHHLSGCAECSRELEAHRSIVAMASNERESIGLPLTRWDSLSDRLHRDGLILDRRAPRKSHWALQIAAALLLVAGGVALGRSTANAPIIPSIEERPPSAAT